MGSLTVTCIVSPGEPHQHLGTLYNADSSPSQSEAETLRFGSNNLCFHTQIEWSACVLELENHASLERKNSI